MMNIKEKLRLLERSSAAPPPERPMRQKPRPETAELARLLGGVPAGTEDVQWIHIVRKYPLPIRHGSVEIPSDLEVSPAYLRVIAKNKISERFSVSNALFFDTETTGLAGGTGTYVFLIGAGYFHDSQFVIEQFFLPTPGAERTMLGDFQTLLQQKRGLISFNGKTFDAPLLTNRFIQQRLNPVLDLHEHLDLLHACRRIVQNDFGDCSLNTLERALLSIRREGDIPGSEIPQAYLNFLREGTTEPLPAIVYHNRMDILTLAGLLVLLLQWVERAREADLAGFIAGRIARLHAEIHETEQAAEIYRRALRPDSAASSTWQEKQTLLLQYARSLKRLKQLDRAAEIWQQVVQSNPQSIEPYIELAKYYEHTMKDIPRALQVTERALSWLEGNTYFKNNRAHTEAHRSALLHRRGRLIRKIQHQKNKSA